MYSSLQIREFDNAIKNYVLESPLPDEVKLMVLEKRLAEQQERTLDTLRREIAERESAKETEVENNAN